MCDTRYDNLFWGMKSFPEIGGAYENKIAKKVSKRERTLVSTQSMILTYNATNNAIIIVSRDRKLNASRCNSTILHVVPQATT